MLVLMALASYLDYLKGLVFKMLKSLNIYCYLPLPISSQLPTEENGFSLFPK